MTNDVPHGLDANIRQFGGALSNMITTPHNGDDGAVLREVERNLATLTERIAHMQHGIDRLTNKLDKIDGELITKDEYTIMKRWLTGTTVGLVVTFILACLALAGVIAIILYLGGLG